MVKVKKNVKIIHPVERCSKRKSFKSGNRVLDNLASKRIVYQAILQKQDEHKTFSYPISYWSDNAETEYVDEQKLYDVIEFNSEVREILEDESDVSTNRECDTILGKISRNGNTLREHLIEHNILDAESIDPSVQQMYEGVCEVMKKYRSGKLPKAFKIIPKLKNWERILALTHPQKWSAAAIYQGTRLFSSALSQSMAQKFFNLILLPRIRDDLSEFKKLNIHLYNALRKALFKPAAFMKGIIIPLLEAGDCTIREAMIFGSVVSKASIPALHSAACLLKVCQLDYSAPNSIFIRIFLNKGYALPFRVVDAAVFHFLKFEHFSMQMPVMWHHSLLTFIQRYKNDISSAQKSALMTLLRSQFHPQIGFEIRRELCASNSRDLDIVE